MLATLVSCLLLAAEGQPVDAVLVTPPEFLPAIQPLIDHRQRQGHRFAVITDVASPERIRASIRQVAAAGGLKYVLIVGDAAPLSRSTAAALARSVPAHLEPAVINVQYGSEPQIATDNWYADLDDDHLPNLAIGRLPADTPAELSLMVAKILAYERNTDFGPWRQRVNFVAGVGGFNPIVDSVIETATSKLLTSGIPAAYETRMTYGSWRSPYCPDPRLFHAMTVERHNEGCLFWVYIGHGQAQELDRVSIPGERFPILSVNDCRELKARSGPPIAIMLACYTAAFDQPQDCLAEQLLKADGGPVAVYGGSRVTMPYAMGVMGTALMDEYFQNRPTTLGETIVAAKRRMMSPADDPENPAGLNRILLDGVAMLVSPNKSQLELERREHLYLFNLLGDPMLTLVHPQEIALQSPREAVSGEKVRLVAKNSVAGRGVLELVCRRDCYKRQPPLRERFDPTDKALAAYQPVYEQSLDRCWARWGLELPAGDFATEIELPREARGPCHIRLLVARTDSYAIGDTPIYLKSEAIETASVRSGSR